MSSAPPHTKAYLLKSRGNSWWVNVELELTDTTLRCVASEYSKWVDEELGLTDYQERLAAGEPVVIFEFDRGQLAIKWLRQFYRGGFQISQGDSRQWLVSLVYPSGFGNVLDLMTDRAVWRQWREALPEAAAKA
ncbi:hypothetical protein Mycsm_05447 [Mycobacterium sp. JS623]|uniref:hypothetical protein n=1 Tax=Mycobacterium sp. JS623 TaxID=212767 RepID=UPI0002A5BA92|nr:hypothetical protein [Mycobacterium sp. JS623]AGB25638.1 hypothetical protein Mycsm_05447 [Mycobacterium sp. JS623]